MFLLVYFSDLSDRKAPSFRVWVRPVIDSRSWLRVVWWGLLERGGSGGG